MSVFQRRLASSTYALLCSYERRLAKLDFLIDALQSGKLDLEKLVSQQHALEKIRDVLDEKTADEEGAEGGLEEHEVTEDEGLSGVVALSLAELQVERDRVRSLLALSCRVYDKCEESKLEKLLEILHDPDFTDEKLIIFTEHRDTLTFLVRRLEGMGFT